MNHEKFTPCQRRFQQHENSITDYNKNVKFSKGTGPKQGDQDRIYYEDTCCNKDMVKIAPPPRRKSKSWRNTRNEIGTTSVTQPINKTLASDFNFISPDGCDFSCMKRCHIDPNNKSDPWMVNVDYRKLKEPLTQLVQNTNFSSTSHTFEDDFVNGDWKIKTVDGKRTALKQQRTESVNIFELGNTTSVSSMFGDFDEIFDSNKTVKPEQLKPKDDSDRISNKMISEPHAVIVKPNKIAVESSAKTVFTSSDGYAKLKKEQINISKHNENVFVQNHGSENGLPTFEYCGNQNIAVNHVLNRDFAESRMRVSSCAKRSGKCEWEMFENCAIVGNKKFFSGKLSVEQFRNKIEGSVFLDEKCLTIVLDLLDSEWRTGNINGKQFEFIFRIHMNL